MDKQKLRIVAPGVVILFLGVVGAIVAFMFSKSQNYYEQPVIPSLQPEITATPAVTISVTPTGTVTAEAKLTPMPTPIVVYEPEGSIPLVDKLQIKQRVIEPFVDYYREQKQNIATISISKQQFNVAAYPYVIKVIFVDGVNQSFVINRSESDISWWKPECLGECKFSEEYKKKYPEVVK